MSTISRTKVWVTGDVLTAADLNGEFNTIYNDYNGSIDHNNLGTIAGTVTHTVSANSDLWDLTKTGSGAGGIFDISDAGTGVSIDIDKTGDGEALNITANNTTGDVVDINSSNTSAVLQRLNAAGAAVAQVVGDGTDNYAQIGGDGVIDFAGARTPGWFCNLGLVNATSSASNDSIKIQGATAALSQTNRLHITVPDEDTIGQLKMLTATADVTITLTGAHWGLGTNGDFSDVELRVYAINVNGSIIWGVSLKGGLRTIAHSDCHTTATSVNAKGKMLVSGSVSSGTWPCVEVGWFHANFDDTGGSSEDLWAVQTGVGDINVGIPVPDQTDWADYTPTLTGFGTPTIVECKRRRSGETLHVQYRFTSGIATSTTAIFGIPSGLMVGGATGTTILVGKCIPQNSVQDANHIYGSGASKTGVLFSLADSGSVPLTAVNGDAMASSGNSLAGFFSVQILNWSSNTN